MDININIKLVNYEGLPLPKYMTKGSAGMDLYACVDDSLKISPGEVALIPTGIAIELPENYEAQLRPRSGLALKWGITLLNSPGTIDSDYRGEIKIILINHGQESVFINRGDRIAQIIFCQIAKANLKVMDELSDSARGEGGFGHTGKK